MPIILANQATSGKGGIQRYMSRLAREIRTQLPITLIEPLANGDRIDGVTYRTFRAGNRILEFGGAFFAYVRALRSSTKDFTLASIWFPSGLIGALIPKSLRGPFAVVAHGSEIAPNRGGLRRLVMRFVFARADAIFTLSRLSHDLLRKAGVSQRIDIVGCGIDATSQGSGHADGPILLSVGRLVRRKGFDRTLDAFPMILSSIPNARYEIVGDGPLREELQAMTRRAGIEAHVTFHGEIDDDELTRVYERARCFALPVRRIDDDVEGFGIVYLEAAMAGLPAIGGRGSGAEEIIVDGITGFLIDGDDARAIADAAITLLAHEDTAREMGRAARLRATTIFSWDAVVKKILDRVTAAPSML